MTKVKICGITNLEDALLSAKFGADALGFNFYEKSPRYISPENAREIIEQLPENILRVGVFVNEELEKIAEIAEIAKLVVIQLHGEETPEFAKKLKEKTNLEIIKAFRVSPEFKPEDVLKYETDAILLDAYNPKQHGGTGKTFDWEIAKKVQEIFPKMYLAGGITNSNVRMAFHHFHPFGIDTCSGVESSKGKKDKIQVINFIKRAKVESKRKNGFQIKNIYDLLDAIQPCPALYLGKYSITYLWVYLQGIKIAAEVLEKQFDWKNFTSFEYPERKYDFRAFLEDYFNEQLGGHGWDSFILKKVDGNEAEAFDLFFALLEEFKLEKEDLGNE
jgi:phosphoribosylanthranilate isomerase